jgi:hypothetical protein
VHSLALIAHLGIEGSCLLELGPAQGLAEGVPEESGVLMYHLPGLLEQLLFIRDTWQRQKQQVSEGWAGPGSASAVCVGQELHSASHAQMNRSIIT